MLYLNFYANHDHPHFDGDYESASFQYQFEIGINPFLEGYQIQLRIDGDRDLGMMGNLGYKFGNYSVYVKGEVVSALVGDYENTFMDGSKTVDGDIELSFQHLGLYFGYGI